MKIVSTLAVIFLLFPPLASAKKKHLGFYLEELAKQDLRHIKVVIKVTDCNVKCGLGSRVETRCYVEQPEEHGPEMLSECEDVLEDCYAIWDCGVRWYHLYIGASIQLDCQPVQLVGHKEVTMSYSWGFAPGEITTDDNSFDTHIGTGRTIKLYRIQERNAGMYRCQMEDSNKKLIKVIYFAVRVIDPSVFNLNGKRLLAKMKLKQKWASKEGITANLESLTVQKQVFVLLGIGIGGSVPLGIIVCVIYQCWKHRERIF